MLDDAFEGSGTEGGIVAFFGETVFSGVGKGEAQAAFGEALEEAP